MRADPAPAPLPASAYFLRQLDGIGVSAQELVQPAPRAGNPAAPLVLDWQPARSDLAPLRVERNHVAVFALRELVLAPGQCLRLQGPVGERMRLLVHTMRLGAGARVELAMPAELVIDELVCMHGAGAAAAFVLAGADGARGLDGVAGGIGVDASAGTPGGAGSHGGNASGGGDGAATAGARITIARLQGQAVFEVAAGTGGDGGDGGRGGKGGQGWRDPATSAMTMGGRGGSGGGGAQGGNGGNGGELAVFIAALAPDARFSTRTPAAPGGAGGAGGRAGIPGLGHPDGALGLPGSAGNRGAAGAPGRVEVRLV